MLFSIDFNALFYLSAKNYKKNASIPTFQQETYGFLLF